MRAPPMVSPGFMTSPSWRDDDIPRVTSQSFAWPASAAAPPTTSHVRFSFDGMFLKSLMVEAKNPDGADELEGAATCVCANVGEATPRLTVRTKAMWRKRDIIVYEHAYRTVSLITGAQPSVLPRTA